MATCWKNPQQGFAVPSKLDELYTTREATAKGKAPANTPETTILGSPGPVFGSSEPAFAPKSTSALKLAPVAMYTETDLQQILWICIGAKKVSQEPR